MDVQRQARLYGALSNQIRLQIVELVSRHKEMCVCELVDQLGMSQANISRHVSILRDAGVLRDRKRGTWVLLRVDEAAVEQGCGQLLETIRRNHQRSAAENAEKRLGKRCPVTQSA